MAPSDRLSPLQMGITWHQYVNVALGTAQQSVDQVLQIGLELCQIGVHPESHISCCLVIAGSA